MKSWLHKPSTAGGIVYLVPLGLLTAGIITVAVASWRTGVITMGAAFGLAFVARLVLPDERAGMLHVRRRVIDLIGLATCSGALVVLTVLITRERR